MSNAYQTPGVYVQELPPAQAVTGVATALPVFVGYTQTGVALKTAQVTTLAEFEAAFGGRAAPVPTPAIFGTVPAAQLPFLLYDSIKLFFDNGGTVCTVVSAGSYAGAIALDALMAALDAAQTLAATMIVIPDAVRLPPADFATLTQKMLMQAGSLQDRIAILDVPVGEVLAAGQETFGKYHADGVADFRTAVSGQNLGYGAAYFPFLWTQLADGTQVQVPPSGALAGIMSNVDAVIGVWGTPAGLVNGAVHSVVAPSVSVTDMQQDALNNDPSTGKSIDAIRLFPTYGVAVWGARTLDGNSMDWRYIQVRRTVIYIEQSIKQSLQQFALFPNDATAWSGAVRIIDAFLHTLWQSGALFGARASDAYSVACGLGTTMTAQDVANGLMRVSLMVSLVHPAEFTAIDFVQKMQAPS